MKAKINTKSNFRDLNGKWLQVAEIVGTRVTCYYTDEAGTALTIDFHLNEIIEIYTQNNPKYPTL